MLKCLERGNDYVDGDDKNNQIELHELDLYGVEALCQDQLDGVLVS